MAVPIPVNAKRINISKGLSLDKGLYLEYAGKKSVKEILLTPPGLYVPDSDYSGGDNRLYHGDNLAVLAALAQDESVAGKVKLVYIDPPYATAASFESRKQEHGMGDFVNLTINPPSLPLFSISDFTLFQEVKYDACPGEPASSIGLNSKHVPA